MSLKTADDFENPITWDAYALAVFANRLNPRVNIDYATEAAVGFFQILLTLDEEPSPEMFQELADEMIEGPAHSIRTH